MPALAARSAAWIARGQHPSDRPAQVDRRRTRRAESLEVGGPAEPVGAALARGQHRGIGRRDANGRRAAHNQVGNRADRGIDGFDAQPGFGVRQQALVEQREVLAVPANGLDIVDGIRHRLLRCRPRACTSAARLAYHHGCGGHTCNARPMVTEDTAV